MFARESDFQRGLACLRAAVIDALLPAPQPAFALAHPDRAGARRSLGNSPHGWLLSEAAPSLSQPAPSFGYDTGSDSGSDSAQAWSSEADEDERSRLIALVELARGGDSEAFGMLYDHYNSAVYRFVYYRVGSTTLAEDITSETFFRALRSMSSFRWQGKDFGAWLMTIARNLTADHFKAGRTRLELATEDMTPHDSATEGPESAVVQSLTNEALIEALRELPAEQQECLVLRFLQGMSIAETAAILDRSEGAVKQLQLRGVRNLAKLLPEGLR